MIKPLSIIVSIARNNAIGKGNDLLFYISEDLKRFKKLTTGHKIIMGRKTFESLPNGPLPNREHIILSRNINFKAEDCIVVSSELEVLEQCNTKEENFVIGGGTIYELLLPYITKMYFTIVDAEPEADIFFPTFNEHEWSLMEESEVKVDAKTGLVYRYKTLVRNST